MASTPCPELPENETASLPWPGRVLDMTCTPCPKLPENLAASLQWPGRVPDIACTPCPEKPENQAVSLPRLGRVPDMACTPCPEMSENKPRDILSMDGRALQRHPFSGLVDSADEQFARQYRCGPPPEFPLASPCSGIVHHLSGPDRYACTQTLLRRSRSVGVAPLGGITPISFLAPHGFARPLTRTHVRLLGPCFKTGRMGSPQASTGSAQVPRHAEGARCPPQSGRRRSAGVSTARALAAASIRAGPCPESIDGPARRSSTSDRDASPTPIRFPPDNFKHSLTFFFQKNRSSDWV
ncbi:Hypothetical predicted protein [Olea europaea subsp. europaea]|uniref:Uncharacterized protein n=1 Tax=Olea europaea subsp. europaea TaxID=158383 RepID=A0A8S0PHB4_OLEEU|nr:Hypothetical predicted protein [Olea europaea subsp. europaea]